MHAVRQSKLNIHGFSKPRFVENEKPNIRLIPGSSYLSCQSNPQKKSSQDFLVQLTLDLFFDYIFLKSGDYDRIKVQLSEMLIGLQITCRPVGALYLH